jgi:3-oxoadipate enol-lactonase
MSVQYIDKMAVDVHGEGETVVMLHGLAGSMNAWTPLMPMLVGYRVVRIEMPGSARSHKAYAMSSTSAHQGQLSADVLADSVLQVCRFLGIERAHLVGHSWGTVICQFVAAKAPSIVRSMTLFGGLPEAYPAMREGMKGRAQVAREQGMFEIAEGISNVALSASTRQQQPVTVAYVREGVAAQDPEGFARNCIALAEAKATAIEAIQCPVLLITGDEDVVTPLSSARVLQDRLPNARLEVLNRCGHWPMLERTEQSQKLLRDFLDRQR